MTDKVVLIPEALCTDVCLQRLQHHAGIVDVGDEEELEWVDGPDIRVADEDVVRLNSHPARAQPDLPLVEDEVVGRDDLTYASPDG
jgi:hypothetical protein